MIHQSVPSLTNTIESYCEMIDCVAASLMLPPADATVSVFASLLSFGLGAAAGYFVRRPKKK